jgi:hypothetical protein
LLLHGAANYGLDYLEGAGAGYFILWTKLDCVQKAVVD